MKTRLMAAALAALFILPFAGGLAAAQESESEDAEIPQEKEKEALNFFRDNNPEMHKELSRSKQEHPRGYRRKMREMMPLLRDPAMREIVKRNITAELKTRRLAEDLRKAEGKEKEALKKDLETSVSDLFDAKLSAHEAQLKKMQDKIAKLKEKIEKRRSLKGQIVKKRLSELFGETESWEW